MLEESTLHDITNLTFNDVSTVRDVIFTLSTVDVMVRDGTATSAPPQAPKHDKAAQPTELITAHTAWVIETVVQAGILPVLVLSGLIMNALNMVVISRQGLRDRINICLFSLAVSDSGYLLFIFSSRVYSLLAFVDAALGEYWKSQSLVLVGVYTGFLNTSNILTLLIALDRCTSILVQAAFLVCLGCCGLACFKYDVISYVNPASNVTHYRSTLTPFYRRNRQAIDAVFQYTFNVSVPTTTLLVVMICTAVIALRMRRTAAWRKQSASAATQSNERRETAVTRMLVVVCVTFTLCTIPTVTFSFVRTLVPGFLPSGRYTRAFYVSNCLMHLLSSVNSSVNFIIYYVMGSKFKSTLHALTRACGSKGKAARKSAGSLPQNERASSNTELSNCSGVNTPSPISTIGN